MGLLDDAIREHLDLKRRRGADPDEVAREEQEALGPPRSGQFAASDEDLGDEGTPEPLPPPEYELEPTAVDAAVEPGSATDENEDEAGDAAWLDEAGQRDEPGAEPADSSEQGTAEFTPPGMEEEPPPPGEDEDVLEETPDFLQETPEHDRLWFEQRPPRDFDFDK
jgi:hypothetical protein